MTDLPKVLITGASSGIGATYAERFAARGHHLVLVARRKERMAELAAALSEKFGTQTDIIEADLADTAGIETVENRLRSDATIGILVNNAGTTIPGRFVDQTPGDIASLIALNTTSVARLANAVAPRFAQAGSGAIINIGSVVGLVPEFGQSIYGATKAFVLYLSQALAAELGPKGIYVQAVLPAATRTDIWASAGVDLANLTGLMEVGDMVDAALVGFDRKEPVTIPPLPEAELWDAFQQARVALRPGFGNALPAARYRATQ